jgi:hypothetical protein
MAKTAADNYLSAERSNYLARLEQSHEKNSQPRKYYCPHHEATYYLKVPTLADEERWSNRKKYDTDVKQFAARIAILLVDENGDNLLTEKDVPKLMQTAGFARHAIDMLLSLGDLDEDEYSEEEIEGEKKD